MKDHRTLEIFYVDDKKTDIVLFTHALEEIDDTPTFLITANSGKEAMEFFQSDHFRPDIIFLDLKMPVMSGIDCLTEIRKMKWFDNTPVIIFSNFDDGKYVEKALDGKANLYIQKPFTIDQQVKLMKELLKLDWGEYFPPSLKKFTSKLNESKTHE